MNETIEKFARDQIKKGIKQVPTGGQEMFKLMYGYPIDPRKRTPEAIKKIKQRDLEDIVNAIPCSKLSIALSQIEQTIKKNNDAKRRNH